MKTKNALCGLAIAVVLQLGTLAGSAQTNIYLFSGSKTNITLSPGTYIITAYGAPGGGGGSPYGGSGGYGGLGAAMSGEFTFLTSTNLTLLVGGGGSGFDADTYLYGYGGGGGSFVVNGSTPLVIAGGGGGGDYGGGDYGSVSTHGRTNFIFLSGYGGSGGPSGQESFGAYTSGGGGGGGGFLGNGGDGSYFVNGSYGVNNGGGGGFSFQNGGGGGIASDYGGGNGGYGGGGSGGGYDSGFDYAPTPGGGGGGGGYTGGPGGGNGGGGGYSIIDSSAIAILTEFSGSLSPDDPANGEIIITAAPVAIVTTDAAFGFTNGVFGFDMIGPSGSNVVIQASTDLQTWIPLQTNLLGSSPLYFSDPQSTTNVQRFYRAQLSP